MTRPISGLVIDNSQFSDTQCQNIPSSPILCSEPSLHHSQSLSLYSEAQSPSHRHAPAKKASRQRRLLHLPLSRASKFLAGSTVASPAIPPAREIIRTLAVSLTIGERAAAQSGGDYSRTHPCPAALSSSTGASSSRACMGATRALFIRSVCWRHVKGNDIEPDMSEAYLSFHFPILSEGGVDLKLGKFVTLEGNGDNRSAEQISSTRTPISSISVFRSITLGHSPSARHQVARSLWRDDAGR